MGLLWIFVGTIVAIFFGWGGAAIIHALADGEVDPDLVVVLVVAWILFVVVAWAAFVTGRWNPVRR